MEHLIRFISINADGVERDFMMTPSQLIEEFEGKCDLPSLNDTIVSCVYADTHLYFKTFSELMYVFTGVYYGIHL